MGILKALRSVGPICVFMLGIAAQSDAQGNDEGDAGVAPLTIPGAEVLRGDLSDGQQDAWRFMVEGSDADALFSLEGSGFAETGGLVLFIRIERNEAGEITDRRDVAQTGWAPFRGEGRFGIAPMTLAAGEYVLGVAPYAGGSGDYALTLVKEEPVPAEGEIRAGLWRYPAPEEERCHGLQAAGGEILTLNGAQGADISVALFAGDRDGPRLYSVSPGSTWELAGLAPGDYALCARSRGDAGLILRYGPGEGGVHEPNDLPEGATPLSLDVRYEGVLDPRAGRRDEDVLRFDPVDVPTDLIMETRTPAVEYSLVPDGEGGSKSGAVRTRSVVGPLLPGTGYTLTISGAGPGDYGVLFEGRGPLDEIAEFEPNDDPATRNILPAGGVRTGRLEEGDSDGFILTPEGGVQLWTIRASGGAIRDLRIYDATGKEIDSRRGDGTQPLQITRLALMPGPHRVVVEGAGTYALRAVPLGPRLATLEAEPNTSTSAAQRIGVGADIRGLLSVGDRDIYRFTQSGDERLRLAITAPLDEPIVAELTSDSARIFRLTVAPGRQIGIDRAFIPGEYTLYITPGGQNPTLDDYRIRLDVADPVFPPAMDREPNDYPRLAENWNMSAPLTGQVGDVGDLDHARIAPPPGAPLTLCGITGDLRVSLTADEDGARASRGDEAEEEGCRLFPVESARDHLLEIRNDRPDEGPLAYRLYRQGQDAAPPAPPAPLDIRLSAPLPTPAAFLEHHTQDLPLSLSIAGLGDAPPEFDLLSSMDAPALRDMTLSGEGPDRIASGVLRLPADLSERELRIHLRVRAGGASGVLSLSLNPEARAQPVAPARDHEVPPQMRGGLNYAAALWGGEVEDLDGQPLPSKFGELREPAELIDGQALAKWEFHWNRITGVADFTIDLAGDSAVPLTGVILTPRNLPEDQRTLRNFAVLASTDGSTFRDVLRAELSPHAKAQAFPFAQPIEASHLQLVALDRWTNEEPMDGRVSIAEFEAIGVPGNVPWEGPMNLADPQYGGHVVWTDPPMAIDQNWSVGLLLPNEGNPSRVRRVDAVTAVIGFHHGRIAPLDALRIEMPGPEHTDYARVTSVRISASLTSPLGPFEPLLTAEIRPDGATDIPLPAQTWARYLKLEMIGDKAAEDVLVPDRVAIFEPPATPERPSILGAWGEFSKRATFEASGRAPTQPPIPAPAGGATREESVPLAFDRTIRSAVTRAERDDWFEVVPAFAPADLRLRLDTDNRGGARPALYAPDGREVPLVRVDGDDPDAGETVYVARIETTGVHHLKVSEPRRAVIVAWDTSGSTNPFQTAVDRALRDIAGSADPDVELVNFLPFGSNLLMAQPSGEPELLLRSLGSYDGAGDSSNSEGALKQAMAALSAHDGVRGIVLITDAATGQDGGLWDEFARTRPMMAALALPSNGAFGPNPPRERDLMETWAQTSDGVYAYVSSQLDFLDGFDRSMARMRAPKPYALTLSQGEPEPLLPGALAIRLAARDPEAGRGVSGTVMMLVDTSGSMLKRRDGVRRYEVAKAALAEFAGVAQESGFDLGVRLFGITPEACDTALLVAPGQSDLAGTLDAVGGILPRNLARTPIGLALAEARSDLGAIEGPRRIIVLTDGEETCDSDPAAEIAALVEDGISTRIDIVGFEIEDAALQATFEDWARLGNGSYTNASGADALTRALRDAGRQIALVRAADGTEVSHVVGEAPLSLPPGVYRVSVAGWTAREVVIEADTLTEVELAVE